MRSWRETRRQQRPRAAQNGDHEGRQGGSGSQEQNGDHEGRQMKRDKAAAAAKSSPEWRSWREQPRMEIMKGDKWRETRGQRQPRAEWRSWRETNEGRQGGSGITTIWRFWGSATQSLRSNNPYSFQLSGETSELQKWKGLCVHPIRKWGIVAV